MDLKAWSLDLSPKTADSVLGGLLVSLYASLKESRNKQVTPSVLIFGSSNLRSDLLVWPVSFVFSIHKLCR